MKRPVRLTIFAAAGLALIFAAMALLPGGLELRASPIKGGEPLLAVLLNQKLGFTLHYYHSVNHKPIWEMHSLDHEGNIFIEEERFVSFNAGMGHWQGHGRHIQKDGLQVIKGIHQPVRPMILRIGSPGVAHTIIWEHGSVNLSAIAPGRAVEISARPVSLLRSLWLKLFPVKASPMAGVEE